MGTADAAVVAERVVQALAQWTLDHHPDWAAIMCRTKRRRIKKKYYNRILREYNGEDTDNMKIDIDYRAQQQTAKDALRANKGLAFCALADRVVYNFLDDEGLLRTFWLYPTDALNTRLRELVHP